MQEQTQPAGMKNNIVKRSKSEISVGKFAAVVVNAVNLCPDSNIISAIFLYRDNKGQTSYIVAPDKDTRNVFRKYMGENPDKYDYSKAQVWVYGPTFDMYLIKYEQHINISIHFIFYTCVTQGPWTTYGRD